MTGNSTPAISGQVLERVHYIRLPATLADSALPGVQPLMAQWTALDVDLHVLDFKAVSSASAGLFAALKMFSQKVAASGQKLVSVNVSEPVYLEMKRHGADGVLNRLLTMSADPTKRKEFAESEKRRILFKYLARSAYQAVEIMLDSTVSCDENYSAKVEDVPFHELDLVSVLSVNNDFMQAEFRLCSSSKVVERLARAMIKNSVIDRELVESTAVEMLNMIYGGAKSHLNDRESFRLPSVIPRLLKDNEVRAIRRKGPPDLTIMPMVTPRGSFYVEVEFSA